VAERNKKILRYVSKASPGVEIGASFNPIAPKSQGYNVHIIDHLSQDELIHKYKNHDVDTSKIEEVDFICGNKTFAELTQKSNYYEWIIASHVIEHTPDLIDFLQNCETILTDRGYLSLVIPDKRYCFDYYRPITGLGSIIDRHTSKPNYHSVGSVAEFFLNAVSRDGKIAWASNTSGGIELLHSMDTVTGMMDLASRKDHYLDIHAWCFVPQSFRLIMHDLFELGFTKLREVDYYPTDGCEFYITLSKHGDGIKIPRIELLNSIESDLRG
jgi:predicted SAM-dependent methyltransferase